MSMSCGTVDVVWHVVWRVVWRVVWGEEEWRMPSGGGGGVVDVRR